MASRPQSANGPGAPGGGGGISAPRALQVRREFAHVRGAPDESEDPAARPRDALRVAQRRDRVGGVLEGVKPAYGVKLVVPERQSLQFALDERRSGHTP